jgi:hypothetical protein
MAGQYSRHDDNWAQVEGVIRLHGRQACGQHRRRHLATLRTGSRDRALLPLGSTGTKTLQACARVASAPAQIGRAALAQWGIARTMLGHLQFRAFFDEVRSAR